MSRARPRGARRWSTSGSRSRHMPKSGGTPADSTAPRRSRVPCSPRPDFAESLRAPTGGTSSIIWSAPDQTQAAPTITDPFEGLALWVEGTGLSQIKGTGTLKTTGVFFLPNATFKLDGQADANNPLVAQFFARTIDFSGQGVLTLTPDPKSSVPTAIPGTYSIIR